MAGLTRAEPKAELAVFARRLQAAAWGAPTSELVATKRWRPRANVVFAARLNRSAAVQPQPGLPER